MPSMFGKDTKKKELINNLDQVITINTHTRSLREGNVFSRVCPGVGAGSCPTEWLYGFLVCEKTGIVFCCSIVAALYNTFVDSYM